MMFWKTYIESNEIDRRKLLETLPILYQPNMLFMKHMSLTLFQSYIDDAIKTALNKPNTHLFDKQSLSNTKKLKVSSVKVKENEE